MMIVIVCKSKYNEILLWKPDFSRTTNERNANLLAYPPIEDVTVYSRFELPLKTTFFTRFSVDPWHEQMVVGEVGNIRAWDLGEYFDDNDDSSSEYENGKWLVFQNQSMQTLTLEEESETIKSFAHHCLQN